MSIKGLVWGEEDDHSQKLCGCFVVGNTEGHAVAALSLACVSDDSAFEPEASGRSLVLGKGGTLPSQLLPRLMIEMVT